ncbi:uncharacterized protein LOC134467591 [Engraulis encrasicolus]|uniref:uncharacterized protein LOC134467591 n=1 Tax=Engraulis encrasicolus TaxID=184585 RepID=UPI002FD684A5
MTFINRQVKNTAQLNANYLLIVVVVSSVLGVALVISMSVTTYAFLRKKKAKGEGKSKKSPKEGSSYLPSFTAFKSNKNKGMSDTGMTFGNMATEGSKPAFQFPRVGNNSNAMEMTTGMGNGYGRPNTNSMDRANSPNHYYSTVQPSTDNKSGYGGLGGVRAQANGTGMNGYGGGASTGVGGGLGGVRAQAGSGYDRGSSMNGYGSGASTPTNTGGGMGGGYRAQANQSGGYGAQTNQGFALPRVGQSQSSTPFNPYSNSRNPY